MGGDMSTPLATRYYLTFFSDRAYLERVLISLGRPVPRTTDKRVDAICDANMGLPRLFDMAKEFPIAHNSQQTSAHHQLALAFPTVFKDIRLSRTALAQDDHRLAVALWRAAAYAVQSVTDAKAAEGEIAAFIGGSMPSFGDKRGNTKAIRASQEYADALAQVCQVEIARALGASNDNGLHAHGEPAEGRSPLLAAKKDRAQSIPRSTASPLLNSIRDLLLSNHAAITQSDDRARKAIAAIQSTIDAYFAKDEALIDQLVAKHFRGLIGMEEVRRRIHDAAIAAMGHRIHLEQTGQELSRGHHMVFLGNPGTGKTTAARKVADLLRELGLTRGVFKETSRADLVASYEGQTAAKVRSVVKGALGGVLFIDEAYSLAGRDDGGGVDFGREAIDELVKAMEDHRRQLVVIVAGYPKEMQSFLDANPGLRSRFTHHITFPDYTPEDMVEVFKAMAEEKKVDLAPEVVERLGGIMAQIKANKGQTFGNGRDVRNLFDDLVSKAAPRMLRKGTAARIELQDLDAVI